MCYVSATGRGLTRPLATHRHVLGAVVPEPQDVLPHLPAPSWAAARRLERELIATLRPAWNVVPSERGTAPD